MSDYIPIDGKNAKSTPKKGSKNEKYISTIKTEYEKYNTTTIKSLLEKLDKNDSNLN